MARRDGFRCHALTIAYGQRRAAELAAARRVVAALGAVEQLANLATKAGVEKKGRFRIHTPLIHLSKADIIRLGASLGVDYGLTHRCYDPAP